MADMLVRLYRNPTIESVPEELTTSIEVKRALSIDRTIISSFVEDTFPEFAPGWVDEVESTLLRHTPTCHIATTQGQIIGFCSWDATARGMVGPLGVDPAFRQQGIARVLIRHTLRAMKATGYAYAVIGWVSDPAFYQKVCRATLIEGSEPGIYERLIRTANSPVA